MRKRTLLVAAGATALMIVSGFAMASAPAPDTPSNWQDLAKLVGGRSAHPEAPPGETLVIVSRSTEDFVFIDVGDPGFSPGDYYVFNDELVSEDGTEMLGQDIAQCSVNFRALQCEVTFHLTGRGTIQVAGVIKGGPVVQAVTGGTHEFHDVGGQVVLEFLPDDDVMFTFHLTT